MQPPNVLFILSDQHNAKCLGHKGHPDVKTPNLDRMASEGTRFNNAITQNPICTPSRVSFLSGQYCHNHGYYGLSGPNPNGLPSMLGHFRQHGYRTAAIGKIHCPEYWVEDDTDIFHETCHCSIDGRSAEYASYLKERGLTELEDHVGMHEFGQKGRQTVDGRPSKVSYKDGQEGWIATKSMEFMGECKEAAQPFFLHVSLPKPHQCYTPSEEFWNLYEESKLTLPPNADNEDPFRPPHIKAMNETFKKGDWTLFEPRTFEAGRLRKLRGYLGNISHVDHAVGELLDFLDKNNISDNTIVVYASDHGDYAIEHGLMEKAPGISHDAITRIPYIWRFPDKIKANHVVEELVESVDVAATLPSLCNIPSLETVDGHDISGLLQGNNQAVRDIAVTEFAWSKSVRKGDWRFVWYSENMFPEEYPNGYGQLYNLKDDPWELKNLFFDPAHQDKVQEMRNDLCEWLITTTRPKTTLGPNYSKPNEQVKERYRCAVNADGKIPAQQVKNCTHINYR